MEKGQATEDIFVANETWFCICSLLLAHAGAIQIYCVQKGEQINPKSMNTDTVEWNFGDIRIMQGGRTNKLNASAMKRGAKKANAFNAAKCHLTGNNKNGDNHFGRAKRF